MAASPNALAADGTSTTALTATARDAQGNAVPGSAVALIASGSSNTVGATSGTTNAAGSVTTVLSSTLGQSETITATLNGNITETTAISFARVANATTSTFVGSPASQTVGTANANSIAATLTLKDAQSRPMANIAPSWSASGSKTTIAQSGNTNASGVATAPYNTTVGQSETHRRPSATPRLRQI